MRTLNEIQPDAVITNLPYTIDKPGSYCIVSNLTADASTYGILISANNVHLNLNGFALTGTTGSEDGIQVSAASQNISVRNGTVQEWGGCGVTAMGASGSVFEFLKAYRNAGTGLQLGADSLVSNCKAHDNGGEGIYVTQGSTVRDCSTRFNDGHGIYAENGSRVVTCTANANGTNGIQVRAYCVVEGCLALWNGRNGIWVGEKCRIERNDCCNNDVAGAGGGAGILIGGNNNRIQNNNLVENQLGICISDPQVHDNLIVANSASGNVTNYVWSTGTNHFGRILNFNLLGGQFVSDNPWSNFDL